MEYKNFLHSVQLSDGQILSKFQVSRTNSVANRTSVAKLRSPLYLKNGLSQLKIFLYPILILLNLDLITFWATSAKQECYFT
ncbi:hypothetical protein O3M35_012217 [Rhynocoris fuscipes]|uniref:Uncharacterized protein n=1 Tax=Rhynocoris fuscipes TaxID=488301 RepID=A0AAW1CSW2_9HEMI